MYKIGLGGGCHWCTEAIFQSLRSVSKVRQGWIGSREAPSLSEAVIVHFDTEVIDPTVLMEIHLRTHSATSNHPMRKKYRSAIYTFTEEQFIECTQILHTLKRQFSEPLITEVQRLDTFKLNSEHYLDYYRKNPDKPFCINVIDPKLNALRMKFADHLKDNTHPNG